MTDEFVRPHGSAEDDDNALPDDELDRDRELGAGVHLTGGTAVDRGAGALDERAQGARDRDDGVSETGDPMAEVLDLGDDPNADPVRRVVAPETATNAPRWRPDADDR